MTSQPRVPRSFVLCSLVILVAGGVVCYEAATRYPLQLSVQLVLLILAVLLSENFAFSLERYSVSLAFPMAVAATVLCGPAAGCLVAAVSSVNYHELRERKPPSVVAYNFGQLVLATGSAGLAFLVLGGRVLQSRSGQFIPWNPGDFPGALPPLAFTAVLCVICNMSMSAVGVSLYRGRPLSESAPMILAFVPTQLALAFVGMLVAQVLAVSFWGLPLFVAPLVVARQLYMRYANLRAAYVDTIRSFIGALEAKDPYTRGHSERVSSYAAALGVAMHLESGALERLEYAALLHDLGKLAVPGAVLAKPGRLNDDEFDQIREHPARGAAMIGKIPHLRDLSETIAQHHERVDGGGYPCGLCGASLSLAARILAVADSFDAMTTTRAYRPALSLELAIEELQRGSGSQFDADVVNAFIECGVQSALSLGEDHPVVTERSFKLPSAEGRAEA
jgi:HD-GYP domain-containing protein (c-di-GMP phosphodiesterase class II)